MFKYSVQKRPPVISNVKIQTIEVQTSSSNPSLKSGLRARVRIELNFEPNLDGQLSMHLHRLCSKISAENL